MIIELTLDNFRSFRESTSVSFAAGTSSSLSGNLLKHRNGECVVKSMALYGPNASGKTTLLEGLSALKMFVLFSTQDQSPTARIPGFEPYLLDRVASRRPSRIGLIIDLDGDRFHLDVSVSENRVWKESVIVQKRAGNQSARHRGNC